MDKREKLISRALSSNSDNEILSCIKKAKVLPDSPNSVRDIIEDRERIRAKFNILYGKYARILSEIDSLDAAFKSMFKRNVTLLSILLVENIAILIYVMWV